jgi:hypothetical protein
MSSGCDCISVDSGRVGRVCIRVWSAWSAVSVDILIILIISLKAGSARQGSIISDIMEPSPSSMVTTEDEKQAGNASKCVRKQEKTEWQGALHKTRLTFVTTERDDAMT